MSFDKYIYEKAENEVKQNRFRAEREAEERALDAERKIPEIKEISNELSRTSRSEEHTSELQSPS